MVELEFGFAVGAVFFPGLIGLVVLNLNLRQALMTTQRKIILLALRINTRPHGM